MDHHSMGVQISSHWKASAVHVCVLMKTPPLLAEYLDDGFSSFTPYLGNPGPLESEWTGKPEKTDVGQEKRWAQGGT